MSSVGEDLCKIGSREYELKFKAAMAKIFETMKSWTTKYLEIYKVISVIQDERQNLLKVPTKFNQLFDQVVNSLRLDEDPLVPLQKTVFLQFKTFWSKQKEFNQKIKELEEKLEQHKNDWKILEPVQNHYYDQLKMTVKEREEKQKEAITIITNLLLSVLKLKSEWDQMKGELETGYQNCVQKQQTLYLLTRVRLLGYDQDEE